MNTKDKASYKLFQPVTAEKLGFNERRVHQLLKYFNKAIDADITHRDRQCPKSDSIYNYLPFVCVQLNRVELVSNLIGEQVLPTYCYARVYRKGEILEKHTDRPACEISLTVHLGGDKSWPVFMGGEPVFLPPGAGALYRGCEIEHWREAYEGNWYAQLFLHYVRAEGPYAAHAFDGHYDQLHLIPA